MPPPAYFFRISLNRLGKNSHGMTGLRAVASTHES
jgi:hypothetical protein